MWCQENTPDLRNSRVLSTHFFLMSHPRPLQDILIPRNAIASFIFEEWTRLSGQNKGEVQGNTQILATRRPRRENPVLINLRDYKD